MSFAFPRLASVDDGPVHVNVRTAISIESVGNHVRRCAGGALVATVVVAVGFRGYDEHDLAVLFKIFILAGAVVIVERFPFVDELDAAVVVCFGFSCRKPAHVADFQATFGNVKGGEVQRVDGAFVAENEDVRGEVWLWCSARPVRM